MSTLLLCVVALIVHQRPCRAYVEDVLSRPNMRGEKLLQNYSAPVVGVNFAAASGTSANTTVTKAKLVQALERDGQYTGESASPESLGGVVM